MTNEELSTYTTIATPFVKPVIDTILKPQLKKLEKWLKKNEVANKVTDNYFEDKFSDYLNRTYTNCSIINTLVFPNQKIKLKDVYEPLSIQSQEQNRKKYSITEILDRNFFNAQNRILIADYAGMGKSTLMKWLTLLFIENSYSIPILVELRKLDSENDILTEIFEQLNPVDKSFDKDLILKFLDLGFFTIVLDGFDEIPEDLEETITVQLRRFINKVPKNSFLITSRPESSLASFGDFQMYTIQPLEIGQSFKLIRKYDNLNDINYSDALIKEIKEKIPQVEDFLGNPLMVSLLYKSYTFNKDIPSKKSTFYEEVYTSLFKNHDLSKDSFKREKNCRLDIYDFRKVLRVIAFETSKMGKVIYNPTELLTIIENEGKQAIKTTFYSSDYLDDLLSTVPLFAKEGTKVKWAHKSIQDYFSAEFIIYSSQKEKILEKIRFSKKNKYYNIIDLVYELDHKLFWKKILIPYLEEFITHCKDSIYWKEKLTPDLMQRLSVTFKNIYSFSLNLDSLLAFELTSKKLNLSLDKTNYSHTSYNPNITNVKLLTINDYFVYSILNISRDKGDDIFVDYPTDLLDIKQNFKIETNKVYIVSGLLNEIGHDETKFRIINKLISNNSASPMGFTYLSFEKVSTFLSSFNESTQVESENNELKGI